MQLEFEAKKLVNYINSLGLNIPRRKPSHKHVGAIIADAVMQIGHEYERLVRDRIVRLRKKYRQAATVSGFLHLLQTVGGQELLGGWKGQREHNRLYDHAKFLAGKGIDTFYQLSAWLQEEENRDSLIKAGLGIRDKTADYYCVLVRLPDAVKVDSRVEEFLADADIDVTKYGYKDLRTVVQLAAKLLGVRPVDLDGAMWTYKEEQKLKGGKSMNKRTGAAKYKRLGANELNQRVDVIRNRGVRALCHECLDLLKRHRCWAVRCGKDNITVHDCNVLNHDKEELLIRFVPRKTKGYFVVRYKPQERGEPYISKNVCEMTDFTNILNCLQRRGRITWWRGLR
jgi:hypothetical protein